MLAGTEKTRTTPSWKRLGSVRPGSPATRAFCSWCSLLLPLHFFSWNFDEGSDGFGSKRALVVVISRWPRDDGNT